MPPRDSLSHLTDGECQHVPLLYLRQLLDSKYKHLGEVDLQLLTQPQLHLKHKGEIHPSFEVEQKDLRLCPFPSGCPVSESFRMSGVRSVGVLLPMVLRVTDEDR